MTPLRETTTEMAARYEGLKAWVAAVSVAGVVVGTAYFAQSAGSQASPILSAADAAAQASAPAVSVTTSGGTTTRQIVAPAPVPVRAKRSRGS
jgi:hypothetical protein